RNVWYGASAASPAEIRDRHAVGVERLCWGTDYPHYEGTYPYTREALRHTFHDVPEGEARQMLGENAASLFGFDLARLSPLVDRIDGIRRVEPDEFVELARQIRVEIMAHAFGGGTVHDADRTLGPDRCELLSNFRTGRVAQADAHRTDAAVMEDSFVTFRRRR